MNPEILIVEWQNTVERMESTLGLSLSNDSHPLVGWLLAARESYTNRNWWLGNVQVSYAAFAIRDMIQIRERDAVLYSYFRRELRRNLPAENYFGLRQEIRMACSLLKKNIQFEKSETPDFVIKRQVDIGIECTSTHLSLAKQHEEINASYKISSAISSKSRKTYSTQESILIIDIGNLHYHAGSGPDNVLSDKEVLRKVLNPSIESSLFQSVLTFSYAFTENGLNGSAGIVSSYSRNDKSTITNNCRDFLDTHFPFGNVDMLAHPHKRV